jgi:drug/metabolite transporter (DMT)-like permease
MDSKKLSWIILLVLSIIWGSSYFLIKTALFASDGSIRLEPDQLGALRIMISGLILIPLMPWKRIQSLKKHYLNLFMAGLIGTGIPSFLFAFAQQDISSSLAGMLNATVPVWTVLLGITIYRTKFTKPQIIGLLVATIGLVIVSNKTGFNNGTFSIIALCLLLTGTFCYALNLNFIKFTLKDVDSLNITTISTACLAPIGFGYLYFNDFHLNLVNNPNIMDGVWPVIILSVFGTALALILLNKLIKISSPIFASTVTYIIPMVAIFIGWLDNELITLLQLSGMAFLLAGVYLINRKT